MDKEIWKPIPGYENRYEVSNLGRVRGLRNTRGNLLNSPRVLKPHLHHKGYLEIALKVAQTRKIFKVHRLVAQVFIPNPSNKPQINHLDGDKTNNKVENLEWCTPSENIKHAFKNNLNVAKKGDKSYQALLSKEQVESIRKEYVPYHRIYGGIKLAKKYGVKISVIKGIVNNKTYVDENYMRFNGAQKGKLAKEQIEEIKKSYIPFDDEFGAKALAEKYNVSSTRICQIVSAIRKQGKKHSLGL